MALMRVRKFLAAVGLALASMPGVSMSFEAVDLLDYSGAELFQRFCASCHGESARGDGPVSRSLAAVVPDLTRISERNGGQFPAARIRETIDGRAMVVEAHGTRFMPVWGYEFWIEEGADIEAEAAARQVIARLIEYLGSIQQQRDRLGLGRD